MIRRARPLDERDPVVVPLVALASRLQALPLGPRDDFRDSLRARLVAAAAVASPAPAVVSPGDRVREWVEGWRVQRGLAAGAAGMAAVVGIAGMSVAASRSLPGDPFYGVKRSAEDVQLFAARGDVARGTRQLQFAETRLEEVARLAGADFALGTPLAGGTATGTVALGSTADRVAGLLVDMDGSTEEGARLLTRAYEREHDTGALKTLGAFADRQRNRLAQIVDELPADARDEAAASLDLIAEVEMKASALLNNGACGDECATPTPTPVATSSGVPQPEPQPEPVPSVDSGAQPQPQPQLPEPAPEPTRAEPSPQPSPSAEPSRPATPAPSPSPQPEPSRLPVPLPPPVGPIVEDAVEEVEDTVPVPLPTLPPLPPAPDPSVPPLP